MDIVYAGEEAPQIIRKSIFLAGPTPREPNFLLSSPPSWRPTALKWLAQNGFEDGTVFVPEPNPKRGKWEDYSDQIEWEEKHLHMADCIVFWVPREMQRMPGMTTNVEFGRWYESGKVVLGSPIGVPKMRYLEYYAHKFHAWIGYTLEETLRYAVLNHIGLVAIPRTGGEREVPLHIWRTPSFQKWYKAQKDAGNRLDGARVVWTFRVGPLKDIVFFWALHVDVFITKENRHNENRNPKLL